MNAKGKLSGTRSQQNFDNQGCDKSVPGQEREWLIVDDSTKIS